jgi:hypothetical protein
MPEIGRFGRAVRVDGTLYFFFASCRVPQVHPPELREEIFIEGMMSDRKLKASIEGSK